MLPPDALDDVDTDGRFGACDPEDGRAKRLRLSAERADKRRMKRARCDMARIAGKSRADGAPR
jgi:hypothetical protein